ncbi:MAG: helix-turn-helix domain-containing protein [Nitrosospira sp.]
MLRFTQALIDQTENLSMGNQHLTVEQRLSYFLLLALDRLSGNELYITHDQGGIFLGVRRESISTAAQKLDAAGAIECRRGHLRVSDRSKLEALTGEYMRSSGMIEVPVAKVADLLGVYHGKEIHPGEYLAEQLTAIEMSAARVERPH